MQVIVQDVSPDRGPESVPIGAASWRLQSVLGGASEILSGSVMETYCRALP
jgi:hypothetical protein